MSAFKVADRRRFLQGLAASIGALSTMPLLQGCAPASFQHGVASGDPGLDRVIIWTRATPAFEAPVLVCWEVSEKSNFKKVVAQGKTLTDNTVDYTVKIDVTGLKPGKKYYYRFLADGATGPIGQTRTLPKGHVESVRFAVFSCSNFPAGYFHVYRLAAEQAEEIDFALHLGDYIYEYDKDGYASEQAEALGRVVDPEHEIISLDDYRRRYARYHEDADLRFVHQQLPFIVVWDDHEVANDAWKEGAENHDPTSEGDFGVRKQNAIQAYYEWMPIRETPPTPKEQIYRTLPFGDLLSLHMLDTRLIGRDEQLDYADFFLADGSFDAPAFATALGSPTRTILGSAQANWLGSALSASKATWQVLGQQVLMAKLYLPVPLILQQIDLATYQALVVKAQTNPASLTPAELAIVTAPSVPLNLDAWDGYPAAREQVLATAAALDKNLISLAGDTHNAWASNLDTLAGTQAGVEFATPSISSPGFEEYLASIPPDALAGALVAFIGTLKYTNTQHRGYLHLTLTHTEATARFQFIDTVKSEDYAVLPERNKLLKVLPSASGRRVVPV